MLCTIFFSKVISAIESIKFCDDGKVLFSSSSLDCNNIGFVRSLIVELCDVNSLMAKFSSFSHQLNFSRTFLMKWINYDKIETFSVSPLHLIVSSNSLSTFCVSFIIETCLQHCFFQFLWEYKWDAVNIQYWFTQFRAC